MSTATGPTATAASPGEEPEPSLALVGVLVSALDELSEAGRRDEACRLAARAWGELRHRAPEQAARLDRLLHRLTRPPRAPRQPPTPAGGAQHGGPHDLLDVRALAPADRHALIFTTFDTLAPGGGFLLVNDHDPKPLYYQLRAEHPDDFTWDPVESGPLTWKVRIGRPAPGGAPGSSTT